MKIFNINEKKIEFDETKDYYDFYAGELPQKIDFNSLLRDLEMVDTIKKVNKTLLGAFVKNDQATKT